MAASKKRPSAAARTPRYRHSPEQRKAREALAWQRQRAGTAPADLKTEPAAVSAKARRIETEAAPIRYVAELIGAIRWLIALMVLCCDLLLSD